MNRWVERAGWLTLALIGIVFAPWLTESLGNLLFDLMAPSLAATTSNWLTVLGYPNQLVGTRILSGALSYCIGPKSLGIWVNLCAIISLMVLYGVSSLGKYRSKLLVLILIIPYIMVLNYLRIIADVSLSGYWWVGLPVLMVSLIGLVGWAYVTVVRSRMRLFGAGSCLSLVLFLISWATYYAPSEDRKAAVRAGVARLHNVVGTCECDCQTEAKFNLCMGPVSKKGCENKLFLDAAITAAACSSYERKHASCEGYKDFEAIQGKLACRWSRKTDASLVNLGE